MIDRYRRSDQTIWKMIDDRSKGTPQNLTLEDNWLLKYSMPINVKLVAVWDTVGSLGIPAFNFEGISRSSFQWLDTGLRLSLENAFHAIAIDDHRRAFLPTLWTKRIRNDPNETVAPPRPLSSVEQRWFPGAHANVGGGYPNDLLAQRPLKWIMDKAKSHGFAFRYDVDTDGDAVHSPIADSYREFAYGIYSGFSWRYYRPIGAPPRVEPNGKHINVNETVDSSVFDRWNGVDEYRPPNLEDWAKQYGVKIEDLHHSVMADDPKVVVSEDS